MSNFGIFVCSKCAGLHRELNHKVKGIGMCVFSNDEVAFLQKWGNEVSACESSRIDCGKDLAEELQEVRLPRARPQGTPQAQGLYACCLRRKALLC